METRVAHPPYLPLDSMDGNSHEYDVTSVTADNDPQSA